MKHTLYFTLAAALFLLPSLAARAAEPVDALAGAQDREARWEHLTVLMNAQPAKGDFGGGSADYRFWFEYSRMLILEEGYKLWQESPGDPRRWAWLQFVDGRWAGVGFHSLDDLWRGRSNPSLTFKPSRETAVLWYGRIAKLKAECIADEHAPRLLRAELRFEALDLRLAPYYQGRLAGEDCDWLQAGRDALAIAAEFPDYNGWRVKGVVYSVLDGATNYTPAKLGELRALLLRSGSPVIREMAGGENEIQRLKTQPLAMRFTAVDGREVDLAKLRGRVVLIDFWAATWCGACKVQEPLMKEVYAKYHEQGFDIIGIACEMKEKDRDYLRGYVTAHEMPWPEFFDGKGMDSEYTERFGFMAIPEFFLIGKDGLLVIHTGSSGGLKNLEAVVRQQLGLPPLLPGDATKVLGARGG